MVLAVVASRLLPGLQQPGQAAIQPSCGHSVNNIEAAYDPRPTECLWQAFSAGKAAQAIMVNYTIEGDPITFAVDIASADQIAVSIQSKDRYGPQGAFAYSCHGLSRQSASNMPGRFYLIVTDCTGPPAFLDVSRLTIP